MVQFIRLRGDFWVGAGFISDHRTASQLLSQREAARMVKNFVQPIILALAYGTCASAKISCHSAGPGGPGAYRKRYLDAGIGDEFAGWRADIERLPDRFARPFQSRPRGASRPVRLGLPGRFGVRTGCQFPQVCPPPCRSATSGAPGTNLGYLTHATTPPGRRTFAAGSSAPACAASASSGRAPRA